MQKNWKCYGAITGKPYGHVPGHSYHEVKGELAQTSVGWRCILLEVWGSAQGYDEEHGRKTAAGRDAQPGAAVTQAKAEARELGMEWAYVTGCTNKLMRQLEDDEGNTP